MSHDDHGLIDDVGRILTRRRMLGLLAATATGVAACDRLPLLSPAASEVVAAGSDGQACVVHPTETPGPFPADGSNRAHGTLANVLRESGIVRRDMRTSLDAAAPVAAGVPLHVRLSLVGVGPSCRPLAGHAIYLWHCDAAGRYSIYDLPDATYLRAVAVTDARGEARLDTIVPGCYAGRYPHMHFEVYPSLETAVDYRNRMLTSQLAVPADVCRAVYAAHAAYAASIDRLARTSLERDGVFRDNSARQLAAQTLAMSRDGDSAYRATVTIGVKPA